MAQLTITELVYALYAVGGGVVGSYALEILKKLSEDIVVDSLRSRIEGDLSALQKRLIGIGDDFAVIRGRANWVSETNHNDVLLNHVPIYDWKGLTELSFALNKMEELVIKDEGVPVTGSFNILSIGGPTVNKYGEMLTQNYSGSLHFDFAEESRIKEDYRPGRERIVIRRYRSDEGVIYTKPEREKQKYLIDLDDLSKPPYGPSYDDKDNIIEDVLLLSVLPGQNGKRRVIVRPGHGSGSKLAEIFCSGSVLEQIRREIEKSQPYYYFQAVFKVPVNCTPSTELYGTPELFDVRGVIV